MGYRVVANKQQTAEFHDKWKPRKGLEGPFNYDGRVLYYDPKEGAYWDPTTDFYLENDELAMIMKLA